MIWKLVFGTLLIALVAAAGTYWFACPCDRIPGGPLSGESVTTPVENWDVVNDIGAVPLCQIEVDFTITRSMNVNCMSVDGLLYVSCSSCANKQWSARALTHDQGFVRVQGKVHPIRYRRVTLESDLDRIWTARLAKIGAEPAPRPESWWSFNLASR